MTAAELLENIPSSRDHLSILRAADANCVTYYVGDDPEQVAHLSNCTLICTPDLEIDCEDVDLVRVENPQLSFYRLSELFRFDYLDYDGMTLRSGAYIHRDAVIPSSSTVGPGCIIGACTVGENVRIESNCVIYARTNIDDRSVIEPNSVIGATGVMWVWDGTEKVFLEQLGGVRIERDCFIGSNVTIVRGNANENTLIGADTCMAHGTMIGHGCQIGEKNHFANNVSLGGSVISGENCFFGSGSVVPPGKRLCAEVILGAGGLLSKNADEPGIYVGVPAKRTSGLKEQMSGIPRWNR